MLQLLGELVAYLAIELLGDALLEGGANGAVRALRTRAGRFTIAGAVGLAVGLAWGSSLSGAATWPRLLWVSLVLAAGGLLLAAGRVGVPVSSPVPGAGAWRRALVPPWLWSSERLVGFAILNASVALGIVTTFRPG